MKFLMNVQQSVPTTETGEIEVIEEMGYTIGIIRECEEMQLLTVIEDLFDVKSEIYMNEDVCTIFFDYFNSVVEINSYINEPVADQFGFLPRFILIEKNRMSVDIMALIISKFEKGMIIEDTNKEFNTKMVIFPNKGDF